MAALFNVDSEDIEGITIFRLEGRLDAASSPILEQKMESYMSVKGKKIVLDFMRVDYLSSAGMRLLLSATKKIKANSGQLVLCAMSDEVMEIIKMAGFEKILKIFSSEDETLTFLK